MEQNINSFYHIYIKKIECGGSKMENATREGYKKILQALRDYVETVNDNEKVLLTMQFFS